MNRTNKYILIKGKEGLGNRILSALTGILYADITGRKYYIDWADDVYSDDGSNAFFDFFESSDFKPEDKLPVTRLIHPVIWKDKIKSSVNEISDYIGIESPRASSTDFRILNYDEDILIVWMCTPEIYLLRRHFNTSEFVKFKHLSDTEIFKYLYNKHFKLKHDIIYQIDQYKNNNFSDKKVIGVHIRYTDKKVKFDKYFDVIDLIKSKEKKILIFLATDNKFVIETFKNKYNEVITRKKWLPENGEVVHLSKNSPNKKQSGIDALIDIYLLAGCDYLVYNSRSTFSYIASFLSKASINNKYDLYKKKLKEYIPKIYRRMIWEFFEKHKIKKIL